MHCEIKHHDIARAAAFMARVADSGTEFSHKCTVLSTCPEGLRATVTTPWYQATGVFPAEITSHGEISVPSGSLSKYLRAMHKDEEVELIGLEDGLYIDGKTSGSQGKLPNVNIESSPLRKDMTVKPVVVSPDFTSWIKLIAFAAAGSRTRPALNGVRFHEGGMVCTDSYKIAMMTFPWEGMEETTIPMDFINILPKPNEFGDGDIFVQVQDNKINFSFGNLEIHGPAIADAYPSIAMINSLLPDLTGPSLVAPVDELKFASDQLSSIAENAEYQYVTLSPGGVLSIVTEENGSSQFPMDDVTTDLDGPVMFSLSYLKKLLPIMKGQDNVMFSFSEKDYQRNLFTVSKDNLIIGVMPTKIT